MQFEILYTNQAVSTRHDRPLVAVEKDLFFSVLLGNFTSLATVIPGSVERTAFYSYFRPLNYSHAHTGGSAADRSSRSTHHLNLV